MPDLVKPSRPKDDWPSMSEPENVKLSVALTVRLEMEAASPLFVTAPNPLIRETVVEKPLRSTIPSVAS